ncbi:MAG: ATP-binding protein [Negativicutes bacterium]|nr:ATP-binding protein [Negativicutes bacterium]
MDANEAIVLEFPLAEADFDTAGDAACRIKDTLKQIGVPSDVIRRVAISSYEAAMNVVIHACRGMMQATIYSDRTELLISDKGPGIADLDLALRRGYSTAPAKAREMGFGAGVGLTSIVNFPDECTIESVVGKGTDIHLVIHH